MKNLLLCFFLSVFCLSKTEGQRILPVDSNKYRIDIPDYWKPGNRVWKILTDKLPLVCNEIKDKELCGDNCNPLFTLEFEMTEPIIFEYFPNHISSSYTNNQFVKPNETWDIQTLYGFECSLLLRNEQGILITRFILVDTNEVWRVTNRVTLASYSPPQIPINNTLRTKSRRNGSIEPATVIQPIITELGSEGETPYSYINRNRERLVPTIRDMYAIADMKINSW
jgi:hypothetical protein